MTRNELPDILFYLLRPIARFCLRHGLHVQDLVEAAKRALLYEAAAGLRESTPPAERERPNFSRLSAATGIHRRDVMRLAADQPPNIEPQSLVSRIIGQWQHDRRFTATKNRARALTFGQDGSEFQQLVEAVSKDLHAGTLLKELDRLGIVTFHDDRVALTNTAFSLRGNAKDAYRMLARDSMTLATAVDENLADRTATPHLHATTEFDNIRIDALPAIRKWLLTEGSKFHDKVRRYLSAYDLDLNRPTPRAGAAPLGGGRVSLTTVSLSAGDGAA